MVKGFNINSILKTWGTFIEIEAITAAINVAPLPPLIQTVADLGLTVAQIQAIKGVTKKMPGGIGGILTALVGIQQTVLIFSKLPSLMASFTSGNFLASAGVGQTPTPLTQ